MKALFSIHEIHTTSAPGVAATKVTAAIPPKLRIISPGTAFYAKDADEEDYFLLSGAARVATAQEAKQLPAPKDAAKEAAAEAAAAEAAAKAEAKAAEKAEADAKKLADTLASQQAKAAEKATKKPAAKAADKAADTSSDDDGNSMV